MAGIDASIPLGYKQPDTTQQLSSLLNMANSAQSLQQNEQKTQQGAIDLQQRQGMLGYIKSGDALNPDGSLDTQKLLKNASQFGDTGLAMAQQYADAHRQTTAASSAWNKLGADKMQYIAQGLYSLPKDAPPDLVHNLFDTYDKQYKGDVAPITSFARALYDNSVKQGGPEAGRQALVSAVRSTMTPTDQQAANTPGGVSFNNGQVSGVISTKPDTSVPQGQTFAVTKNQIKPEQQQTVRQDALGNSYVEYRDANGNITGTGPVPGASNSGTPSPGGPFALPPNETPQTMADLQAERTAAKQAAVAAPVMHDINKTIVTEASKGFNTGSLGALTQKVASATGYQLGPNESATDYNVLGKMLERSALTAAQSMGPHTNAGLEAAVRANGSLEYTPAALKKIAYLNDALTTGSELYQHGLENAIAKSGNGVFAKRQFDQQWGQAATPQALRLKNAVDQGNQEEVANIVKEVGGKGTKGAQALHQQLRKLIELSGQ